MLPETPPDTPEQTANPPALRVGWIGLGDQGLPMAIAVANAGFALHVWARRPGSLVGLAGAAHQSHDDLAVLASESDILGLCVGTDDDVRELLAAGLFLGLRPGSILVNHGTGTPANAAWFAETGASVGVDVLDAPVSGGRPAAEERRLTTMVGGPRSAAERARPVFESFSRDVVHLGDAGAGQTAKLLNNTLMMMNQAAIADTFALADRLGLDAQSLYRVLSTSSGGSTVLGLVNTMITEETVEHLAQVQTLDMELFDSAVREAGLDPTEMTARGLSGTRRIAEVLRLLNGDRRPGSAPLDSRPRHAGSRT